MKLKCGQNRKERIRRFLTQMQQGGVTLIVLRRTQSHFIFIQFVQCEYMRQVAAGKELGPYDKKFF